MCSMQLGSVISMLDIRFSVSITSGSGHFYGRRSLGSRYTLLVSREINRTFTKCTKTSKLRKNSSHWKCAKKPIMSNSTEVLGYLLGHSPFTFLRVLDQVKPDHSGS